MAAAVTLSIGGVSYATLNTDNLKHTTQTVADRVSCRTVDEAIVAYVGQHNATPKTVKQLQPWVKGDVSAYRIVKGQAVGPGC